MLNEKDVKCFIDEVKKLRTNVSPEVSSILDDVLVLTGKYLVKEPEHVLINRKLHHLTCVKLGLTPAKYSAKEIARYVIEKCYKDEKPITNLTLQRLLYCIQIECLKSGLMAFSDDFVAVKWGPCVMDVYYTYCAYGASTIFGMNRDNIDLDLEYKQIIDMIIESKRELMPWEFVEEYLTEESPWAIIFENGKGNNETIPIALLKGYVG